MTEPERRAAELRTLLARLRHQRALIDRVGVRLDAAAERADGSDSDAVAATALYLQHYYTAIEDALVALAQELDGSVPGDAEWHRRLLEQMSLDIPGIRPAILDTELLRQLDVLRRFWHRVRHAYDEEYVWDRMSEPLEARTRVAALLPAALGTVEDVVDQTIRALERS
jgi:hypothetical protein